MILDHISNTRRYEALHPEFRTAFSFLKKADLATLPDGLHDLAGDRCFVVITRGPGRGREAARLEVHRKYIDIQFAIEGTDEIGWKPANRCTEIETPFDTEQDAGLFADAPDAWITLSPQTFAVFFPEDAHAPLGGKGHQHKAVVKIMEGPL